MTVGRKAGVDGIPYILTPEEGERLHIFPELVAACEEAQKHLDELVDAWQRGALTELDGLGGTRSNRNMDTVVLLQAIIAKARAIEEG